MISTTVKLLLLATLLVYAGKKGKCHDLKRSDDVSTSSLEILLQQQTALIETLQTRLTAAENKLNDVEGRVRAHDGKMEAIQQKQSTSEEGECHAVKRTHDVSTSSLETLVQQQVTLIETMQAELTATKNRLSDVENELHEQKREIAAIKEKQSLADNVRHNEKRTDDVSVSSLQALVQQQAALIQTLQTRLTAAENRLNSVEGNEGSVLDLVHTEGPNDDDDQASTQVTTSLSWTASLGQNHHDHKRNDDVSVSSLETLVQQQAVVIQTLQTKVSALENNVHAINHDVAGLKLKHPNPVGFSKGGGEEILLLFFNVCLWCFLYGEEEYFDFFDVVVAVC
ncbi:hypothetical protein BaRGS_00038515 [Batillaria attramentaria]|uniref:Uncharacterized protein n=1 Tax=Batillaria attramentaria TaxID=370345 RepID=A0ABD0J5V7_9CAEN